MSAKRTALVTAIGSFSADTVIRELKKLDYRVVGTDIYPGEWVAASRDADVFYQAPPAAEEDRYIAFIRETAEKEGADRIVPLIDVEVDVLSRHRNELETGNRRICISDQETIEVLRNKLELTMKVNGILSGLSAEERGLVRVIPSSLASDVDFESITYPLILKPVNGRSSIGLYKIYQEDQLGFAFSNIMDPSKLQDTALSQYIVQPLIKGNVVTVDIVSDGQGNVIAVPREELLRTPNGAGLSVKIFEDEDFIRVVKTLAKEIGILGCVNFEFIRGQGSGVYYFIECNPRFSGGVAFTELAGIPVVKESMQVFDGQTVDCGRKPETGYMTRKYVECRM